MVHRTFPLVVAALFSLSGCASVTASSHPVSYSSYGDAETVRDYELATMKRFEEMRQSPPADQLAEVKILLNSIPKGLELKGNVLTVEDGYPHAVLGRFVLSQAATSTFWFADYTSIGWKVYCYPQVPVTWLTFGLWQILVPLSYPCAGGKLTRDDALIQLKALAASAGGNLVLAELSSLSDSDLVFGASGYVIRTELDTVNRPTETKSPARDEL